MLSQRERKLKIGLWSSERAFAELCLASPISAQALPHAVVSQRRSRLLDRKFRVRAGSFLSSSSLAWAAEREQRGRPAGSAPVVSAEFTRFDSSRLFC